VNELNKYKEILSERRKALEKAEQAVQKTHRNHMREARRLMKRGKVVAAKKLAADIRGDMKKKMQEITAVKDKIHVINERIVRIKKVMVAAERSKKELSSEGVAYWVHTKEMFEAAIKTVYRVVRESMQEFKELLSDKKKLSRAQGQLWNEYNDLKDLLEVPTEVVEEAEAAAEVHIGKAAKLIDRNSEVGQAQLEVDATSRKVKEASDTVSKLTERIRKYQSKYTGAKIIEARLADESDPMTKRSPTPKGSAQTKKGLRSSLATVLIADPMTQSVVASIPVGNLGDTAVDLVDEGVRGLRDVPRIGKNLKATDGKPLDQAMMQRKSPARQLIFRADGGVYENTVLAMHIALKEWLGNRGYEQKLTAEDVTKYYGIESPSAEAVEYFSEKGVPMKYITEELGRATLLLMGVKLKKDSKGHAPKEAYSMVEQSMGAHVMLMGKELGKIDVVVTPSEEMALVKWNSEHVGATSKQREAAKKTFRKDSETKTFTVEEAVATKAGKEYQDIELEFAVPRTVAGPLFREIDSTGKAITIRRNDIADAPIVQQSVTKKMMKMKWTMRGLDDGHKALSEMLAVDNDVLRSMMGATSVEELEAMSYTLRESAKAKGKAIDRSIEDMQHIKHLIESGHTENELWFKWFVAKSSRLMMDSATVNPQMIKLHRLVFRTGQHKSEVSMKVGSKSKRVFDLGLALAFGFDVDKLSLASVSSFVAGLDSQYEEIMEAWELARKHGHRVLMEKRTTKDGKEVLAPLEIKYTNMKGKVVVVDNIKLKEVAHVADGIEALREMRAAADKGADSFSTSLRLEADAVTSGFALKLMQIATGLTDKLSDKAQHDAKAWLKKTGLFSEGASEAFGDMVENGDIVDAYKTLAAELTPKKLEAAIKARLAAIVKSEVEDEQTYGKRGFKTAADVLQMFTGPLQDDDGNITGKARLLLKFPFMTFQYGAGFKKNIQELSDVMMEDYETKINEEAEGSDEFIEGFGVTELEAFKEHMMKNPMETYKEEGWETDFGTRVRSTINDSYGSVITEVLTDEFKHSIEVNKVINGAMKVAYSVWNKQFMKKLKEFNEEGEVSKDNIEKLFADEELLALFPIIEGPLSDGYQDGVAVFKSRLMTSLFEGDEDLGNKYGRGGAFVEVDKSSTQVSFESVRRGLAEAGAAGGVIPIHALDAVIIAELAAKYGVLEVHDALVLGIEGAEDIVKEYNERVFAISRDWNYLAEVYKTLDRVLKSDAAIENMEAIVDENDMDLEDLMLDLHKYAEENAKFKEEFFKKDTAVQHMVLTKESEYVHKGDESAKSKVKNGIMAAYEKLSAGSKELVEYNAKNLIRDIKKNC